MANTNTIPDPYRNNEANVRNFADHIREKAALEQLSVRDMASREISRFRDVTFGVNTQYGGSQLRLRNSDGKVITKLKKDTQLKIMGDFAQSMDDDRNKGNPDEHIWVQVEVDATDTEKGGKAGEKVQGWVSTEYIKSLGEPESIPQLIVPIAPPEEKPEEWVYPEAEEKKVIPKPPKPRPDILKPIDDKNSAGDTPAPSEKIPEKENSAGNIPAPKDKTPESGNLAGDIPAPEDKITEKENSAGNIPAPGEKIPNNGNSAGDTPAPKEKTSENGNDGNTPSDMATPKEKLDAPEVNKAPEGLWSKFVSFNKNILRKAMSPFKEEITMANNIANDDSKKS